MRLLTRHPRVQRTYDRGRAVWRKKRNKPGTLLFFDFSTITTIGLLILAGWLFTHLMGSAMASSAIADELPLSYQREIAMAVSPLKLTLAEIEPRFMPVSEAEPEEEDEPVAEATPPAQPDFYAVTGGLVPQPAEARASATQLRFNILRDAYRFIGTRYRWGGTSPRGFDCSGFVQYVLNMNGIAVARTARDMQLELPAISAGELLPGDLVFFDRPDHVGIYIGQGRFIHASSGGKQVTITPLDKPSYQRRFIGAARILSDAEASSL